MLSPVDLERTDLNPPYGPSSVALCRMSLICICVPAEIRIGLPWSHSGDNKVGGETSVLLRAKDAELDRMRDVLAAKDAEAARLHSLMVGQSQTRTGAAALRGAFDRIQQLELQASCTCMTCVTSVCVLIRVLIP